MTIDVENIRKYVRKEPFDEPLLLSTLQDIARLVISRHFSSYNYRYDDLVSLSIEKAVVMLKRPDVRERLNLVNFLYTGMRNSIGNDIKKEKRCLCQEMVEEITPGEPSADLCLCDLRESVACHVSDMVSRLRSLGCDPRHRISSFIRGQSGDPISRLIVRVASLKALLQG